MSLIFNSLRDKSIKINVKVFVFIFSHVIRSTLRQLKKAQKAEYDEF